MQRLSQSHVTPRQDDDELKFTATESDRDRPDLRKVLSVTNARVRGSSGAKVYVYKKLHHDDSIRITKLLPGCTGAPLACEIVDHRKSDGFNFEALSYVWGNSASSNTIEEMKTGAQIPIKENLFDALRQLRHEKAERRLWIDQLCINQEDAVEKAHQVAHMDEIYRNATKTLVWLGRHDAKEGIEELEAAGRDFEQYGYKSVFPFPYSPDSVEAFERSKKLIQTCNANALRPFFESEWFERLWVVQEFILAMDISIHCGEREISYELFSKASCVFFVIKRHPMLRSVGMGMNRPLFDLFMLPNYAQAWELVRQRERYRALHHNKKTLPAVLHEPTEAPLLGPETADSFKDWSFVYYCAQTRALKCTNPLDRVYGVLGFANTELELRPDYEHTTPEQLWTEVATKSLANGDLTVLHYAGLRTDGLPQSTLSFVADLGRPILEFNRLGGVGVPMFDAGTAQASLRFPHVQFVQISGSEDESPLLPSVRGRMIDVATGGSLGLELVKEEATRLHVSWGFDQLRQIYIQISKWIQGYPDAYPDEKFFSVFGRCVVADNAREQFDTVFGEGSSRNDRKIGLYLLIAVSSFQQESDSLLTLESEIVKNLGQVTLRLAEPGSDRLTTYEFPSVRGAAHVAVEHDELTGFTESMITELEGPLLARLKYFLELVSVTMHRRMLFITRNGFLGVGPTNIRAGDVVFVPQGAETPFVLRPYQNPDGKSFRDDRLRALHQIVGECYLHGFMDGEAFDQDSKFPETNVILI